MADYREISQEYAKSAIGAAMLINAGASVAVLSQLAELYKLDLLSSVVWSVMAWTVGVVLAALAWPTAFLSSRFVDKSERDRGLERAYLQVSNRWMHAGVILVFASILCFAGGAAYMACQYSNIPEHATIPTTPP
jgi:predicted membrane channel-forming protein YqfA (hemolysin III family)